MKLTRKMIEEALLEIIEAQQNTPKERKIVAYRGCIHMGGVSAMAGYDCGDPECPGCTIEREVWDKEIEKYIRDIAMGTEKEYKVVFNDDEVHEVLKCEMCGRLFFNEDDWVAHQVEGC